jgi:hypothetical protein
VASLTQEAAQDRAFQDCRLTWANQVIANAVNRPAGFPSPSACRFVPNRTIYILIASSVTDSIDELIPIKHTVGVYLCSFVSL